MNKETNYQFRILYVVGIIAVVAYHCHNGALSIFNNWFALGTFHLGIFAFTSGYFFLKNYDKPIKEVLKKKFISLIVTLYVWNVIYGILINVLHVFGIKFGQEINLKTLFLLPLYDGHQFVFNLGSWFVVPLFMIQFISIFLIKLTKRNRKDGIYIIFLIYLLLGMRWHIFSNELF